MKSISKTNVLMILLLILLAVALIACNVNELAVVTMPTDETLNATPSATAVNIEVAVESVTPESNLSQPAPEEEVFVETQAHEPAMQPILTLADYPPSDTPYYIENDDLWLVHTPEGQLYAFAPIAPTYAEHIDVDECRYTWSEPQHPTGWTDRASAPRSDRSCGRKQGEGADPGRQGDPAHQPRVVAHLHDVRVEAGVRKQAEGADPGRQCNPDTIAA